MDRRTFIGGVAGGLFAAPLGARAQSGGGVYQVGLLTTGTDPARSGFWQKFLEAMRELTYVEGRNLIVRRAFADGEIDRLPRLAADLVQAKVDVIVTTSTPETLAAKSATSVIPIVMTVVPDPVEQGLVVSLARPGGNVTGLTGVVPGISQQAAAQQIGITMSFIGVRVSDDIDPALAQAKKVGAGGIIAPLAAVTYRYRTQLVRLTLKHRLPGIYWDRDYVGAGGLMSYGASDVSRRAAYFVDKILKGAKPSDLPVEQPTKFELIINLMTAKTLGLTIPQPVLLRADAVIQ